MMTESMETLEIEVRHKASGATNEIDKLTDSLLRLNRILAGTTIPKLEKLADALGDIGKAKASIDRATGRGGSGKNKGIFTQFTEGQKDAIRNMEKQNVAWLRLAKRKDELEEALNKGDAHGAIKARDAVIKAQERFRKESYNGRFNTAFSEGQRENIRNLEKYEVAWMKLAEAKEKLEHALNTGDARGAIKAREAVINAQEKYNKEYYKHFGNPAEGEKTVSPFERIRNALNGVNKSLQSARAGTKELGKEAKKTQSSFGKLGGMIKRIILMRMIRSAIRTITKAFSEGMKNMYQFSSMIGSSFSQTMDALTSQTLKMKNQMGASLGELLTTIQPILEFIIRMITKAADAVSQFFAVLGGRSTYHKALDSTAKWVEETEKGADAAKEWKNQLMGFDEINRLEAPSDTGSGADGAGNNIGNWALSPITMDFSWLEKIKEFIAGLNLDPLMESLGRLKEVALDLFENIKTWLAYIWENVLAPFITWVVEELAPVVINAISSILEVFNALMEVLGPVLMEIWESVLAPLFEWIGDVVISALTDVTNFLHDLAQVISGEITWDEFINGLSDSELLLGSLALGLMIGHAAFLAFNAIVGIGTTVVSALSGALAFLAANPIVLVIAAIAAIIAIVILAIRHWEEWKQKLQEWKDKFSEFVGNGKLEWQDFVYFFVNVGERVMLAIENIIRFVGRMIDKLKEAWKWVKKVLGGNDGGGTSINSGGFSGSSGGGGQFASGGWPNEGEMFFARENGAGPEMVGTIGNRTAVATNNDIVAAIEGGVYRAMASAMSSGSRSGGSTVFNINGREFMRAIWDDRNAVIAEHGVSLVTNG